MERNEADDDMIECLSLLVAEETPDLSGISRSESRMLLETRSGDNDRLPLRLMDEDDREEAEMFVLSLPRFPSLFLCVAAL